MKETNPKLFRGSARPSSMEASHKKHRPHIKVGKDAEEEDSNDTR